MLLLEAISMSVILLLMEARWTPVACAMARGYIDVVVGGPIDGHGLCCSLRSCWTTRSVMIPESQVDVLYVVLLKPQAFDYVLPLTAMWIFHGLYSLRRPCWWPWPMFSAKTMSFFCAAAYTHVVEGLVNVLLCNRGWWWCLRSALWSRAVGISIVCTATTNHTEVVDLC